MTDVRRFDQIERVVRDQRRKVADIESTVMARLAKHTHPAAPSTGVSDHGLLTGLLDDDHPQYHNDVRGDIRYYTKAQVDTSLGGKAASTHAHAQADVTGLVTALAGKEATGVAASAVTTHEAAANPHPGYQPLDSDLTTIAGLAPVDGVLLKRVTGAWAASTLVKADVGLGSVDNTSDASKPVSTAAQTALDLKAPLASPAFTGTPTGITKAHVGLGSADNTADTAKPVSTATQTALNGKANTSHTHVATTDLTATGTKDTTTFLRGDNSWAVPPTGAPGGGVTAHSALTGLTNDDHPQYHTDVRGDVRYYLKADTDTALAGKAPTVHAHAGPDITSGTVGFARLPVGTTAGTTIADGGHLHTGTYAPTSHAHAQADVTGLVTDLAGKAPTVHTHAAADVTSGTLDIARIPTGATGTTVPLGNDARFTDARTPTAHTHVATTDLTAVGTKDATTFLRGDNTWAAPAGGGVTSHAALTGLAADDHTQYLTNARGDARYKLLLANGSYSKAMRTTDISNSLAGAADNVSAGLNLAYPASCSFTFEFFLFHTTAAAATALIPVVSTASASGLSFVRFAFEVAQGFSTPRYHSVSTIGGEYNNGAGPQGTPMPIRIWGAAVNPAAANAISLLFRSEVAASAVTIHSGSWGRLELL